MNREERRYYDERAAEYDDWWLGRGLFAARERPGWDGERAALERFVRELPPRRTLDIACGTGYLTRHLRGAVTALDQSARMVARARERCPGARVVADDALALPFPDGSFDAVFTAHFYGHLRARERARFLAEARRVAAGLVVVDTALRPGTGTDEVQERVLSDGSRHSVYKRFFTAEALAEEIGGEPLVRGAWFVAAGS